MAFVLLIFPCHVEKTIIFIKLTKLLQTYQKYRNYMCMSICTGPDVDMDITR